MSIQLANQKILELYKHAQISGTAPRFESINGKDDKLTLSFISLPNRSIMDAFSFRKIIDVVDSVFNKEYVVTSFAMGRNTCAVILSAKK